MKDTRSKIKRREKIAKKQFLLSLQSHIIKEVIEQQELNSNYIFLDLNFRDMIIENIQHLDTEIRDKCINLSYDLQEMNSADRLAFLFGDKSFGRIEKIEIISTCMKVMEVIEEYEICATLNRLVKYMQRQKWS